VELENLEHIKSCVDEMLEQNGLNFKPEFVAKVVTHRLNIAMFDAAQTEMPKYQPSSMFDFGDARAHPKVSGQYGNTGRATSPGPARNNNNGGSVGNVFSFMRAHAGELGGEPYITTDEKRTSCLSERFRSYLASIDVDKVTRKHFGPRTALSDLPHDMMFLIGLQFGQINVGTWNPFMVAAKKYLAFQTVGCTANTFFLRQTDENKQAAYGAPDSYVVGRCCVRHSTDWGTSLEFPKTTRISLVKNAKSPCAHTMQSPRRSCPDAALKITAEQ
jgi:hypothetical protein